MRQVIFCADPALRQRLRDRLARVSFPLEARSLLSVSAGSDGALHLTLHRAGGRSLHVARRDAEPLRALQEALPELALRLARESTRVRRVIAVRAVRRPPAVDRAGAGRLNSPHGSL